VSGLARVKLLDVDIPSDAVRVTDATSLSQLPLASEYVAVQANFTSGPSGPTYTLLNDVSPVAGVSTINITVVDTTPGIVSGWVRVAGLQSSDGEQAYEDVDISAGAGVYPVTTVFDEINGVHTWNLSVLGGAGDETIKVEWDDATDIVSATNLINDAGASYNVFVQTTIDNEVTWCDIGNFVFTTLDARRIHAVKISTALSANVTPTDGAMSSNTILSGLFGNKLRLKTDAAGDYVADGAHITVDLVVR
jgi:hypothetical protein